MSKNPDDDSIQKEIEAARTQSGESLLELSRRSPLLVIFLRHGGCPFCRETLAHLAKRRAEIAAAGALPVLVHMMADDEAGRLFARYDLADLPRISDPEQRLHQALDLNRGSALDVMGPKVWWQGFKSVLLKGNRPGLPSGDVFQLGGAFLIHNGNITAAHRSRTSADQPDLVSLATADSPTGS